MIFPDFRNHTYPLVIKLKVLKVYDNSLPADLKDMFKLKSDIHSHQTRQPFYIPAVNL